MAGNAFLLGMSALQRELCLVVVIGRNLLPALNDVAGLAFAAQVAFVWLPLVVAIHAGMRRLAIFFAGFVA